MALSERVDLTENRDFSEINDFRITPAILDMNAVASLRQAEVELQVQSGQDVPVVVLHKIYPWSVTELDNDVTIWEHASSFDFESNMVGFEFWDGYDRPFVLGNTSQRKTRKWMLEQESCFHCDRCGRKLNIFDQKYADRNNYRMYLCKYCCEDTIRERDWLGAFAHES